MISFLCPSIFNVAPFNAFLEENTIPGSGFCSLEYFLESLEIDLFTISFDQTRLLSQLLIIEIGFRKRLFRMFCALLRTLGITTFSAF